MGSPSAAASTHECSAPAFARPEAREPRSRPARARLIGQVLRVSATSASESAPTIVATISTVAVRAITAPTTARPITIAATINATVGRFVISLLVSLARSPPALSSTCVQSHDCGAYQAQVREGQQAGDTSAHSDHSEYTCQSLAIGPAGSCGRARGAGDLSPLQSGGCQRLECSVPCMYCYHLSCP
jgi:hypothetical protein